MTRFLRLEVAFDPDEDLHFQAVMVTILLRVAIAPAKNHCGAPMMMEFRQATSLLRLQRNYCCSRWDEGVSQMQVSEGQNAMNPLIMSEIESVTPKI